MCFECGLVAGFGGSAALNAVICDIHECYASSRKSRSVVFEALFSMLAWVVPSLKFVGQLSPHSCF